MQEDSKSNERRDSEKVTLAASHWIASKDRWPAEGRSYLVRTVAAGPVYDVAFYNGVQPGGLRQWLMTDCELNAAMITHWAMLYDPDDDAQVTAPDAFAPPAEDPLVHDYHSDNDEYESVTRAGARAWR